MDLTAIRNAWRLTRAPFREAVAEMSHDDIRQAIQQALDEAMAASTDDPMGMHGPWTREVFDDAVVYEFGGKLFRSSYTITDAKAELGEATEVRVAYVPVNQADDPAAGADANTDGSDGAASEAWRGRTFRETFVRGMTGDDAFRREVREVLDRLDEGTDNRELVDLVESAVTLREAAVSEDGTARIKLIQPGWGASGYYSRPVLERDGPKVFTRGTKMFWDHPTRTEERERPEGTLEKLAAELTEDASFDTQGADGPGLYANARVFEKFKPTVEDLAPHIGVSIRAAGKVTPGTAEGRTGLIIDQLVEGYSADFVTMAGAGGKVVDVFEAAGRRAIDKEDAVDIQEATRERDEARERAERAETALRVVRAREVAATAIAETKLPQAVAARVIERVGTGELPTNEDGTLDEAKVTEAAKAAAEDERKYLAAAVGTGRVIGLGESGDGGSDEDPATTALSEGMKRIGSELGHDGDQLERFAAGRS